VQNSAAPQALGFNGFFKGAYSYHYHNYFEYRLVVFETFINMMYFM